MLDSGLAGTHRGFLRCRKDTVQTASFRSSSKPGRNLSLLNKCCAESVIGSYLGRSAVNRNRSPQRRDGETSPESQLSLIYHCKKVSRNKRQRQKNPDDEAFFFAGQEGVPSLYRYQKFEAQAPRCILVLN